MDKKNKLEKYTKEWYWNIFDEYVKDNKTREIDKKLYSEIYKYYKQKKDNKDLNINIERIGLNKKSGKYKGFGTNIDLQIIIVVFTIFLSNCIGLMGSLLQIKHSSFFTFILSAFVFFYFLYDVSKSNTKEKEFVYNLGLKVLDDIEKEVPNENSVNKILSETECEDERKKDLISERYIGKDEYSKTKIYQKEFKKFYQKEPPEGINNLDLFMTYLREYYNTFAVNEKVYKNEINRLKCIINAFNSTDISNYVALMFAVLLSVITILYDKIDFKILSNTQVNYFINALSIGYYISIAIIVILSTYRIASDFISRNKKSFYMLCLDILQDVGEEKFKIN